MISTNTRFGTQVQTTRKAICALAFVMVSMSVDGATPPAAKDAGGYKTGERLAQPAPAPGGPRQIRWEDLYPKGWDPYASVKGLDFSRMTDGDPRAIAAMEKVRAALNNAPVIEALDGVVVRIPGFIIPMDVNKADTRSFLLVPYFGACIHTPPPPANQIIDVQPATPLKDARMMDTVWVVGKLQTVRSDSPFGAVGYRLIAQRVEPYVRTEVRSDARADPATSSQSKTR